MKVKIEVDKALRDHYLKACKLYKVYNEYVLPDGYTEKPRRGRTDTLTYMLSKGWDWRFVSDEIKPKVTLIISNLIYLKLDYIGEVWLDAEELKEFQYFLYKIVPLLEEIGDEIGE